MNVSRRSSLQLMIATGFLTVFNPIAGAFPGLADTSSRADGLSDVMDLSPDEKIMGSPDALVTIIEYTSMTCPHCATFHEDILPAIREKYIDAGKARLVLREFPVSTKDVRSIAAFMLAGCAGEDRYFPMISMLFKKQSDWAYAEDPVPVLLSVARLAGFTKESFDACLKDQKQMDSVLAVRNKAANNYGVSGTPTFFINGKKQVGNVSVEEFSRLIENAL